MPWPCHKSQLADNQCFVSKDAWAADLTLEFNGAIRAQLMHGGLPCWRTMLVRLRDGTTLCRPPCSGDEMGPGMVLAFGNVRRRLLTTRKLGAEFRDLGPEVHQLPLDSFSPGTVT